MANPNIRCSKFSPFLHLFNFPSHIDLLALLPNLRVFQIYKLEENLFIQYVELSEKSQTGYLVFLDRVHRHHNLYGPSAIYPEDDCSYPYYTYSIDGVKYAELEYYLELSRRKSLPIT